MKHRLLFLAFLLFVSTVLPAGAQTGTATPTPIGSYVTARDIYVRGGPSEAFLPVGRLVAGNLLLPLNRSVDGRWVLIRYNRGFGWIRADLGFWDVEIDALPTLDEANLTPTPEVSATPTTAPTGVMVDAGREGAYIRFGPSQNFPFLGAVVSGDYVEPVGRDLNGEWILIRFRGGFGWISRRLLDREYKWNQLPVLLPDALTPSATFTPSLTPTASDTPEPTFTPSTTPTMLPPPTNTLVPTPAASATLLPTNTNTPTPVPSMTSTGTPTDAPTSTSVSTSTPSSTPTHTATDVPTLTDTPTDTPTDVPTSTNTPSRTPTDAPTATDTPTETDTATHTRTPTSTPTAARRSTEAGSLNSLAITVEAALDTETPSTTPTFAPTAVTTASPTDVPTRTRAPTETDTPSSTPTKTATDAPATAPTSVALRVDATSTSAASPTDADTPSRTPTNAPSDTPTSTPSETPTGTPSETPSATSTPTRTSTVTPLPSDTPPSTDANTATNTATSAPVGGVIVTGAPPTPIPAQTTAPNAPRFPSEALVGGALLVIVLAYVGLYWRGLSSTDRYAEGFVIERCPICKEGHLTVETRQDRFLGIPRPRSIVRCDHCRSVLRQVGAGQWRYAVDSVVNGRLYSQLNGRVVDEETLVALERESAPLRPPVDAPTFVDDEE